MNMELVKILPANNILNSKYAIYDLSDVDNNPSGKRYLFTQKFSEYSMEHFSDDIIIQEMVAEAEYRYDQGFFDTIKECDLAYQCACLTCKVEIITGQLNRLMSSINELS